LFEDENLSIDLYNFYLEHAQRGLHSQSPITRTKCITILAYLSRIRLAPILPLLPILEKQQRDQYWELQGQILILSSNALVAFNTLPISESKQEMRASAQASQDQAADDQEENKNEPQVVPSE
jgi:hypothetical protein